MSFYSFSPSLFSVLNLQPYTILFNFIKLNIDKNDGIL